MRITLAALAGALLATAAQAGSIQVIEGTPNSYPSIQAVGDATVALPAVQAAVVAEPITAEDGRSQLEAWAKANNTTVEKLLLEKTNGFLKLKDPKGNGGNSGGEAVASSEPKPADDEKTASVGSGPSGGSAPEKIR